MAAAANEADVFVERFYEVREAAVHPVAQCEDSTAGNDLGRAVWVRGGGGRGTGAADDGGLY